ncbi:hypothetical protein [Moorena sp. SIO3I6]|uniref:hypothetical protein n=1 Tax=Moorena sp. SIO3I6 TaxID=2607831 RepID=UPI0013F88DDC|nr:hypothetical protein [Moorena sp. SIO3I6]NEO43936.1 hypothetical protein [Moorena sp. SIO4A3]NEP29681.1 hypothetical protein [Moorena sp. SIO3I6]
MGGYIYSATVNGSYGIDLGLWATLPEWSRFRLCRSRSVAVGLRCANAPRVAVGQTRLTVGHATRTLLIPKQ